MKTLTVSTLALCLFGGLLAISTVEYQCKPYKPGPSCPERSRFEVHLFDYENRKLPIGIVETPCIVDLGERYTVSESWFEAPNRPAEYFAEPHDLPKRFTEVCRVE